MSIVITRLFERFDYAKQAVAELESSGIAHSRISVVGNNGTGASQSPASDTTTPAQAEDAGSGAGAGASIGTVLGGGAGLLAGLGMLAIPGIGPVVAAGWLVATAVGAGVGAGAGGLLGSLVGAGVSESDAHVYSEGVRRGGTLVTVRAEDSERVTVEQIMARYNGVDAETRGAEYRASGWERFDEASPAYIAGGTPSLGLPLGTVATPGASTTASDVERREPSSTLI